MNSKEELASFVRGMAWHDIAKPLYLANPKHTLWGYFLLDAIGREEEAVMALCHWRITENLEYCFQHRGHDSSLPLYLALGSALDVLSSVTYATEEEQPENTPNPSVHNPFSRLPIYDQQMECLLAVESPNSGDLSKAVFREDFKRRVVAATDEDTWNTIEDCLENKLPNGHYGFISALVKALQKLRANMSLKEILRYYMDRFGERTYPTANDTSLWEHNRLSAALAYVVYANFIDNESSFLQKRIIQKSDSTVVIMDPAGCEERLDSFVGTDPDSFSPARKLVTEYSGCYLVRVSFRGLQDLFENAPRLADLLGVREMLESSVEERTSLKEEFKQALAEQLGMAVLAEDVDLVLSETLFDLFYLLPACYHEAEIEDHGQQAYRTAVSKLVSGRLKQAFDVDFGRLGLREELDYEAKMGDLTKQLLALPLAIKVSERISVEDAGSPGFREWCRAFGRKLVETYRGMHREVPIGPEDVRSIAKVMIEIEAAEKETAGQVCDICGSNPIYSKFVETLSNRSQENADRREALEKAVRMFRGQPESPCIACVSIRLLAHKIGGARALEETLARILVDEQGMVVVREADDGFPDIPPLMRRVSMKVERGQYLDLGAAFVRRDRHIGKLERFPTLGYAADFNGNVALIELRPVLWLEMEGMADDETQQAEKVDGLLGKYGLIRALDLPILVLRDRLASGEIRGALDRTLGPITGALSRLDSDPHALAEVQQQLDAVAGEACVQELVRLHVDIRKGLKLVTPRPLPAPPLTEALGELTHLSDDVYRQALTQREQIEQVLERLNPLRQPEQLFTSLFGDGSDLDHFQTYYRHLFERWLDEKAKVVEPHMARVLQRITFTQQNFFDHLQEDLENPAQFFGQSIRGIRVLPLQMRYPQALFAVPADRVADALQVIHASLTCRLFSSRLYSFQEEGDQDRALWEAGGFLFLQAALPKLFYGIVTIFKHKQPLYVVMSTLRQAYKRLHQLEEEGDLPAWNGILFGMSDLRGVMSERAWVQAQAPYIEMFTISDLANQVDRYSVIHSATLRQQVSEEVGAARLQIRGDRQHWRPETINRLQQKKYFDPVLFLKVMARG